MLEGKQRKPESSKGIRDVLNVGFGWSAACHDTCPHITPKKRVAGTLNEIDVTNFLPLLVFLPTVLYPSMFAGEEQLQRQKTKQIVLQFHSNISAAVVESRCCGQATHQKHYK